MLSTINILEYIENDNQNCYKLFGNKIEIVQMGSFLDKRKNA